MTQNMQSVALIEYRLICIILPKYVMHLFIYIPNYFYKCEKLPSMKEEIVKEIVFQLVK